MENIRIVRYDGGRILNLDEKGRSILEKSVGQVKNYFEIENFPNFNVFMLNSRSQMDMIFGYETENWVGACAALGNIAIFERDLYEDLTCYEKDKFDSSLTHEMTHIYVENRFGFVFPMWLNEGLAYTVAENSEGRLTKREDVRLGHNLRGWAAKPQYISAGNFVDHLVDCFGKDKLFDLMDSLKRYGDEEYFGSKFKENYGFDFNGFLKGWLN